MCAMVSEDFRKQALGYGLTTAHILYRRPDYSWLLQSSVWQNYDLLPEFPELVLQVPDVLTSHEGDAHVSLVKAHQSQLLHCAGSTDGSASGIIACVRSRSAGPTATS